MSIIAAGQVYRDTSSKRSIRLLSQVPGGRWLAQGVTDRAGAVLENGRKTTVSVATLATGYELVSAGTSVLDDVIASLSGTRPPAI